MPTFSPEQLTRVGCEIFEAAGCPPDNARAVVDHLVESNLFGHDSHGAIRFHEYAVGLRTRLYQADTAPTILRDAPCSAVVDGGGALGAIGATFATSLAIDKAREHGLSAVALRHTSHIGRVGAYPLLAARQGLICQIFVNAGHQGIWVAPFGGIDGRLSTNPIAFAAPRRTDEGPADPIMLDMTTSMGAIGKVWVAANRGVPLPEGWILDPEGRPSTNPNDLIDEPFGAMLPLGGSVGYKGTGLCLLVEILGGALGGQGCANGEREVVSNGVLITAYRIDNFTDEDAYFQEVETLIAHLRTSRTAPGVDRIMLPGEIEFETARRRRESGIEIDDVTWSKICEEAEKLGLDTGRWG